MVGCFSSITLLLELFVNCLESKDRASFEETVSGLTWSSQFLCLFCRNDLLAPKIRACLDK
jgi:hypothetical protein